jgi:hypothetical protein
MIETVHPVPFLLGGLKIGFKMACFKIDRMTLNLQVEIWDCWVLGPYPPCTLNAIATTWIFAGGVSNQTSSLLAGSKES